MSTDKFYFYIVLVSAGCITFAITLVLALRKFSKKPVKLRMEFAAVLFLVALLLMARAEKSLPLAMLFKIIAFDLIIVCPVWLLVWKYRSELKKIPIPKWLYSISIPFGLAFWKWLHSFSVVTEYTVYFIFGFLFLLMSFMFSKKELDELHAEPKE